MYKLNFFYHKFIHEYLWYTNNATDKKFSLSNSNVVGAKESSCGCAGIYNAPHALESYLTVFEEENAIVHFEAFASENGPNFYGLPLNEQKIVLKRTALEVPETLAAAGSHVVLHHAGETLQWQFAGLQSE